MVNYWGVPLISSLAQAGQLWLASSWFVQPAALAVCHLIWLLLRIMSVRVSSILWSYLNQKCLKRNYWILWSLSTSTKTRLQRSEARMDKCWSSSPCALVHQSSKVFTICKARDQRGEGCKRGRKKESCYGQDSEWNQANPGCQESCYGQDSEWNQANPGCQPSLRTHRLRLLNLFLGEYQKLSTTWQLGKTEN